MKEAKLNRPHTVCPHLRGILGKGTLWGQKIRLVSGLGSGELIMRLMSNTVFLDGGGVTNVGILVQVNRPCTTIS